MDKNTDQIAAEAAWTDDTVYDLLAKAFESGGEIRGGQLIAQRHNETVQSAIEKATVELRKEIERQMDFRQGQEERHKLELSRAAHASEELHRKACEALWDGKPADASEQGMCVKCGCGAETHLCPTLATGRATQTYYSQRPTPATEGCTCGYERLTTCKVHPPATASEQGADEWLEKILGEPQWSVQLELMKQALSKRPTPATPTRADLERRERDKHEAKMATPATASDYSDRPPHEWGTNRKRKPAHASEQVTPSGGGEKWTVNYNLLISPNGKTYHIEDDHQTEHCAARRLKDEINQSLHPRDK